MSARLFCKTGDLAGAEYVIGDEAVIGRESTLDIPLHPKLVSGRHAKIYFNRKEESYFLVDLKSRNGTKLDGIEVSSPTKLGPLHVITFADRYDFVFQVLPEIQHIFKAFDIERHKQEEVIQEEIVQEEAIREEAVREEVVQEEVVQEKAVREESIQEEAIQEEVVQEEAIQEEIVQEEVVQEEVVQEEAIREESVQEEAIREEVVQEEVVQESQLDGFSGADSDELQSDVLLLDEIFYREPGIDEPKQSDTNLDSKEKSGIFLLTVENVAGSEQTFSLVEGEYVIGRHPDCKIHLDDSSVSRNHAVISIESGVIYIEDLGSKNFTYVNGERITQKVMVLPGSIITIGPQYEALLTAKD